MQKSAHNSIFITRTHINKTRNISAKFRSLVSTPPTVVTRIHAPVPVR